MDKRVARMAKGMVGVIRAEQQRRSDLLLETAPDAAHDHWLFTDTPFINELCLMLLVALRHHVERELVRFAARSTGDGKEINRQEYQARVAEERGNLSRRGGWGKMTATLKLKSCNGQKSMETLRFLVNSYKHNPSMEPDDKLLECLNLETGVNYAPIPESRSLQEALAVSIGLEKDASYYDIAEQFVEIAHSFLDDVQNKTKLSRVKPHKVSATVFAR